uniref:ParA family protein n=1 Tax=Succinivibrio sp. TaxID=2053619 RepID=UPI003FEFE1BB
MGRIITISNPKGGTAKTSTAVNLSCALRTVNKKVLLIDFDPQRSSSVALGYEYTDVEHNIATAVLDGVSADKCITPYPKGGFDVILSSDDLVALPTVLREDTEPASRLKKVIANIKDKYDFLIIDTPASMNLITINALCAADYLVLPVCCDMFAIDSMKTLLDNLLELKEKHLSKCNLLGILRTIYDPMQPLASRISHELAESFKDLLFATKISYNPKISESSSAACPVLVYDRTSLGSREYLSFAGEILKKLRQLQ